MEKTVTYSTKNTYETLNSITLKTKNVWLVFHGIGYLSRYFIQYFSKLNPEENYIVAPQAPSKYYLKNEYKYVGASWLTKESTPMETENVLTYVDAVFKEEELPKNINLVLFGFSQGVSIVMRWMAQRQIKCHALILYAGGIPNELEKEDFEFVDWEHTRVKIVYGDADSYLNKERRTLEQAKIDKLFSGNAEMTTFEGGHEMKPGLIPSLI